MQVCLIAMTLVDAHPYYGFDGHGLGQAGYGYGLGQAGYGYGLGHARYGHGLGYYNVYYGKRSADAEPTAVAHHYNSDYDSLGYDNNGFAVEGYFMHQCDPPSDGDGCPDCGQVLIKAMKAHWPCF